MTEYQSNWDELSQAITGDDSPAYVRERKQVEQQSKDWFAARLGKFTASRMPDLMGRGRGELFGAKAVNYVQEIIIERTLSEEGREIYIEQQMNREFVQTKWGNKYEPEARKAIEDALGLKCEEVTFRKNELEYFGGSADFVCEGVPGEIKCPFNVMVHQNNLELMLTGLDKSHTYYAQIQAHIMNFNSDRCVFASYDPRRDEKSKLAIIEVCRDEAFISEMLERLELAEKAVNLNIYEGIPIQKTLNNK